MPREEKSRGHSELLLAAYRIEGQKRIGMCRDIGIISSPVSLSNGLYLKRSSFVQVDWMA